MNAAAINAYVSICAHTHNYQLVPHQTYLVSVGEKEVLCRLDYHATKPAGFGCALISILLFLHIWI